jgi:hypothetical protein
MFFSTDRTPWEGCLRDRGKEFAFAVERETPDPVTRLPIRFGSRSHPSRSCVILRIDSDVEGTGRHTQHRAKSEGNSAASTDVLK